MRDIIFDENFFKIENLQTQENNDGKIYLIMRNDIAVFINSHNKINHIIFHENNVDIRKDVIKKIKGIKNLEVFPYGSVGKNFINHIKSLNFDNLFIHELIDNKETVFNTFFKKAKKFYTEHKNKRNVENEKTINQTINPLEYFFTIKNEIFLNTIVNKRFIDILNLKQPFNANYVIVNQNEAFFFNDKIVKKIYCNKDLKIGDDFVQFMKNHKNIQCFLSPDCSDLKDKIHNSSVITKEQDKKLNIYSKRIHGVIKKHIDRTYNPKINKSEKSEKKGISNFFSEAYDFKSERKLSYQDFEKQLKNIYDNKDKFLNKEVDTNYSPNVFIKNNLAIFMDHGKIRHIIYEGDFFEKLKNDLNNYKNINIVADKNIDLKRLNQSLNKNVSKIYSLVDKEKIFSIIDYGVRKHILNNKNNLGNFSYMTMKDTINSIQHSENWKKNNVSFYRKNQSDIINLSGYIMTNEMISKNDNDTYIIYSDGSLTNNIPIHSNDIETFNMGCSFLTYRVNKNNEIDLYQYGFCGASYNGKSSSELAEQIALDMSHLSKDVVENFIHYLDNLNVVKENPFCLHTKGHVKQNDIYNQNGANELTDYLAKKVRKKNKITPEEIIESFNNFYKPLKQEEVISSLQFVK